MTSATAESSYTFTTSRKNHQCNFDSSKALNILKPDARINFSVLLLICQFKAFFPPLQLVTFNPLETDMQITGIFISVLSVLSVEGYSKDCFSSSHYKIKLYMICITERMQHGLFSLSLSFSLRTELETATCLLSNELGTI